MALPAVARIKPIGHRLQLWNTLISFFFPLFFHDSRNRIARYYLAFIIVVKFGAEAPSPHSPAFTSAAEVSGSGGKSRGIATFGTTANICGEFEDLLLSRGREMSVAPPVVLLNYQNIVMETADGKLREFAISLSAGTDWNEPASFRKQTNMQI